MLTMIGVLLIPFAVINERRFLYPLYPFLIIFATLEIKEIIETFNLKFIKNYSKHFLVFIMSLVVLSSVLVIHGVDEYGYGKPDIIKVNEIQEYCLLYTSPSPRDKRQSRMPSSA